MEKELQLEKLTAEKNIIKQKLEDAEGVLLGRNHLLRQAQEEISELKINLVL